MCAKRCRKPSWTTRKKSRGTSCSEPRTLHRSNTQKLRSKAVSHLRHTGRELAQILGRCTRRLPPFGNENTSAINEISG
ncbi:hypothetical protein Y032_0366g4 [Ancylostoma ceylanicum]|uniref:Uncharacterized protein n=1 Tax=Ancylostoma ceylanicum TaxID=53326 RepID=A0A016RVL8_9BILA|nr:hypothetical protein Y032_0366g4 [Ancylostoma ceylanicum]